MHASDSKAVHDGNQEGRSVYQRSSAIVSIAISHLLLPVMVMQKFLSNAARSVSAQAYTQHVQSQIAGQMKDRILPYFLCPLPVSRAGPLVAAAWVVLMVFKSPLPLPTSQQQYSQQQQQQQLWTWNLPAPWQLLLAASASACNSMHAAVAPAATTAAACSQRLQALLPLLALLLATWVAVELAFYLLWFQPCYRRWNKLCNAHESAAAKSTEECYALFKRFIQFVRGQPCHVDFLHQYLSMWFRGSSAADIKRGNMEELFSYGFFYRTREQMAAIGLDHLPSEMATEFEDVFSVKFLPGYNPRLKFMSHLWEDLRVQWRPLAFYMVTEMLALLTAGCMRLMGFKRRQLGELHYYTRGIEDTSSGQTCCDDQHAQQHQQPIVFIHGVAGLLLYLPLLARLAAEKAPLVVLDMKHVALRLSSTIPTIDSLATSLAAALTHHNLPAALLVSHSYGTLVAGRLLRLKPAAVSKVFMVDPVCFGMFMPRLLHGFIYAPLRFSLAKPLSSAFNLMLNLVSKDIHLTATFARKFYWSDLNLWPEDLPEGSVVVLSGGDALVSSLDISIMLQNSGRVKVIYKEGLIHGGFLLHPATLSEVLENLTALAIAAAAAAGMAAGAAAAAAAAAAVGCGAPAAVAAAAGGALAAAVSAVGAAAAAPDNAADESSGVTSCCAAQEQAQEQAVLADNSDALTQEIDHTGSSFCSNGIDGNSGSSSNSSSITNGSCSRVDSAATDDVLCPLSFKASLKSSSSNRIARLAAFGGRGFSADAEYITSSKLDGAAAAAATAAAAAATVAATAAAANGAAAALLAAAGPVVSSNCTRWLLTAVPHQGCACCCNRCFGGEESPASWQPQLIARRYTVH